MCCHPICFHNLVKFIAEHNKRDKNLSTITVKKDHRGECAYYSSDDRAGQRKPRPRSDKPNNRGILILPASRWPPIVRARRDSHREIIIYDFNALDVLYFFFFFSYDVSLRDDRARSRDAGRNDNVGAAGSEAKRCVLAHDNELWSTYIFWKWGSAERYGGNVADQWFVKPETVNFLDKLFQLYTIRGWKQRSLPDETVA